MSRTQILYRADRSRESDRQDSAGSAEARVALKLAAEGYNAALRADGGGRLTLAALAQLRHRAIWYYAQIEPTTRLPGRLPVDLRELHDQPVVDLAFAGLQVASMAYSNTRLGGDACVEYSRAAIADLCNAATRYADALLGALSDTAGEPQDQDAASPGRDREPRRPHPRLGDGT